MVFTPVEGPNSCVINSIAYIAGFDKVPVDWMTDLSNLYQMKEIRQFLRSKGLKRGPMLDFTDLNDVMEHSGSSTFVGDVKARLDCCDATFGILLTKWTYGMGHAMIVQSKPSIFFLF